MNRKNLNRDTERFLQLIQATPVPGTQDKLVDFFSTHTKSAHIVHDRGEIYYYVDDQLIGYDSVRSLNSDDAIYTYNGNKITITSPITSEHTKGYQMKSGGSKSGTKRRTGGGGGISSNNNNNNNNNNNG